MRSDFSGFKDIQKQLEKLSKEVSRASQPSEVPLDELCPRSFMKEHTSFNNIWDFLKAGNFKIESYDDIEDIPDEDLDAYISAATDFESWDALLEEASAQYFIEKLNL